jgi:hypothetical protein
MIGRIALNQKSSPNDHLDRVRLFTINPHKKGGQYKFFGTQPHT